MTDKTETNLDRRNMLRRIGLVAAVAYSVPAFTTLSMAQAASGVSDASSASISEASVSQASVSEPSLSDPSVSDASIPSVCDIESGEVDLEACEANHKDIFDSLFPPA